MVDAGHKGEADFGAEEGDAFAEEEPPGGGAEENAEDEEGGLIGVAVDVGEAQAGEDGEEGEDCQGIGDGQ